MQRAANFRGLCGTTLLLIRVAVERTSAQRQPRLKAEELPLVALGFGVKGSGVGDRGMARVRVRVGVRVRSRVGVGVRVKA